MRLQGDYQARHNLTVRDQREIDMHSIKTTRRVFLTATAMVLTKLKPVRCAWASGTDLEEFIRGQMETAHIPGLGICVVRGERIAWSKGYGWANIEQRMAMTPDSLMNIASVSKTVTATALMQLWESGKFQLDEDVNSHLPFRVKNPFHPEDDITFRQLLTHTSSIKDGSAYGKSYTCGDPAKPLGSWLKDYLTPEGALYRKEESYSDWKPGEKFDYTNVGFGLAGYLVEIISGMPFVEYCKARIFKPLRMDETSWLIADLPRAKQAVPYTYISEGKARGQLLEEHPRSAGTLPREGYIGNCFYSFPNLPDGLVRTSVNQLARFVIVWLNRGVSGGTRVLRADTVAEMLREQFPKLQGLAWRAEKSPGGDLVWGHGGADPGVSTTVRFRLSDKKGVLLFANTGGVGRQLSEISARLFQETGLPALLPAAEE